jgi:hypothetical protein
MKKKKSICLTAVVTAVLISGCVMNTGARVYDSDRAIASSSNSYNLTDYTGNQNGNTVSGSAEKLEGMDTVWSYEAEEEKEVTLSWKLNVSSGKAKFVLINPDGELTTLVECFAGEDSEQSSSGTFEIKQGENRVKLVGAENTSLEYEFTADEGEVSSFG